MSLPLLKQPVAGRRGLPKTCCRQACSLVRRGAGVSETTTLYQSDHKNLYGLGRATGGTMMSSRVAPKSAVIHAGARPGWWPGMHPTAAATSTRSRTSTLPALDASSSAAAGFLLGAHAKESCLGARRTANSSY